MRAHNERLVLTLVRQHGALPKSDIARITGLSAQTVSVIMRKLEAEGFLISGEPVRGKVGQPSVPMSLNPSGALFFGLKVGRRTSEMVLIDFLGQIVDQVDTRYHYPTPELLMEFARSSVAEISAGISDHARSRIAGLGVATPFELWNWAQFIGAPEAEMDLWRDFDFHEELEPICGCEVFVQNDATAACGAELVFGTGDPSRDFLYVYIGFFVGGGVVLNGSIYAGRTGNAGALGSMPVPNAGGAKQLIGSASIATLEQRIRDAGADPLVLWDDFSKWNIDENVLSPWVDEVGRSLAYAVAASASIMEFEACLIDGRLPDAVRGRVVDAVKVKLAEIDVAGMGLPCVREGSLGAAARSLGAASLPLSNRFLVDQNAL